MEEQEKNEIGVATPEQVQSWKKKHGDVWRISVDGSVCYLRKPNRTVMRAFFSTNDFIKKNEILLENCWLGGDESIKTDDDKFFGASAVLSDLIDFSEAKLVKL